MDEYVFDISELSLRMLSEPAQASQVRWHGFVYGHTDCRAEAGARGELALLAWAAWGWHEPGTERADSLGWHQ